VPEPLDLRTEPAEDGQSMRVDLRARDAKFQPIENAQIKLQVRRAGAAANTPPVTFNAEPSATEPGLYQATFLPRENGGYLVTAEVTNEAGVTLPPSSTGWSTDFAAAEYRATAPNRALMEEIARRTGGKVITPDGLASLARELPQLRVPLVETISRPLWHTPWFFLVALTCLIAEWGLRRKHGLA
jgi:hypothetical protein